MLAVILAAAVGIDGVLQRIDEFCTKADIEINHPITQEMLTKESEKPEKGIVLVRIRDRYRVDYYRGAVRGFADLSENVKVMMTRLDPEQMTRWSAQACPVDQPAALEIARGIFHRLGFDDSKFDPVEVHRYSWQPSEANPEHVLWLPLFQVTWFQKGTQRDQALPPSVTMDISGTTKRLVYYHDATREERNALALPSVSASPTQPDGKSSADHNDALRVSDRFFRAVSITPQGDWQKQAQVTVLPQDYAPIGVIVQNRYILKLRQASVYEFSDRDQRLVMVAAEDRTADLRKWAGVPVAITETQAVQIAAQFLTKLGFDTRKLNLSKTEHDEPSMEDPEHPGKTVALPPTYRFHWVGKRPFWARHGTPDLVGMEIFTANGALVHYYHGSSSLRFWSLPWLKWVTIIALLLAVLLVALRRFANRE